jgi:hypothetical protein
MLAQRFDQCANVTVGVLIKKLVTIQTEMNRKGVLFLDFQKVAKRRLVLCHFRKIITEIL